MTIAARINILFISAALFLGCTLTALSAHREYQRNLEQVVQESQAMVLSRPDLQVNIYRRDSSSLSQVLGDFLQPAAVSVVTVYDSLGEVLADRTRPDAPSQELPSFATLRADFSAIEPSLTSRGLNGESVGTGVWSSLVGEKSRIHFTMPVFSPIDPTQSGLAASDFFMALGTPETRGSLVVIGYIHIGIDRAALLQASMPTIREVFLGSLMLTLICVAAVVLLTRQITQAIVQLAQLADDVVAGKLKTRVEIRGSSEIMDIANVLNGVLGGVNNYKKEMDVDHHLLSLRADEGASQLSRRNRELDQATEEINETRNQMQKLAYYDSLTSLPNRRLFTEQLSLLLRLGRREKKPLGLLFLNLDNFKRINDSLGHSAGDLVLREAGKRLTDGLRDSDMLAHNVKSGAKIDVSRLGGDEFTVVLNQLDESHSAGLVAQRLIEKLAAPIVIEGHELVVSPSIGIAIAPDDAEDVEGLLKAAGTAMHYAKASATHDFLFYNQEMDTATLEHLKLESDLRKAIEREQLILHYQPQVDTVKGSVLGAEALLRWEHPEYGLVPPYRFISLAEETGLIAQLGDWVLVEACRQMAQFRKQGLKLPRVAINISAIQFNAAFVARVKEVLQEVQLPPATLELGLSESILMDNNPETMECLTELKAIGVYLSVDDFGTCYAPLNYLSRYPLDELKIDRSFVMDCAKDEHSARLVTGIIAMAQSLNLNLVAEGVETVDQFQFLSRNGARVMQGYWLSKPVPAAQLSQLLVPWHFMEQVQRMAS